MFLSLIEQCYRELLSNVYVDEHRTYYERHFIVTETKYGRSVEPVNPYTEIESPICESDIYRWATDVLPHAACPVPCALIKAVEVVSDMGVKRDVSIQIE